MVRDQQTSIASFMTQPRTNAGHRSAGGGPSSPIQLISPVKRGVASSSPGGMTPQKRRRGQRNDNGYDSNSSDLSVERLDKIKLESKRTRVDADDEQPEQTSGRRRKKRVVDSDDEEESAGPSQQAESELDQGQDMEDDPIEDVQPSGQDIVIIDSDEDQIMSGVTTGSINEPGSLQEDVDASEQTNLASESRSTRPTTSKNPFQSSPTPATRATPLIPSASPSQAQKDPPVTAPPAKRELRSRTRTGGEVVPPIAKSASGPVVKPMGRVTRAQASKGEASGQDGTPAETSKKEVVRKMDSIKAVGKLLVVDVSEASAKTSGPPRPMATRARRGRTRSSVQEGRSLPEPSATEAPPPKIFESSDEEPSVAETKAESKRRGGKANNAAPRSGNVRNEDKDEGIDEDEDEDDIAPRRQKRPDPSPPSGRMRTNAKAGPSTKSRKRIPLQSDTSSSEDSDSDSDSSTSDSGQTSESSERVVRRKGKGKGKGRMQVEEASIVRRKKVKGKGRAKIDPDDEDEEIDQAALLSEIEQDEPVVVSNRLRKRDKQTEFQRNLEIMKRKKLGGKGEHASKPESVSSEDSGSGAWTVETVSDEEGWIADDPDDNFNSNDLPANYRMSAHQSLEHHFKIIVQYMVGLVVIGEDYIDQQKTTYFKQPFDTVRRKLEGIKDSAVTSSVWPTKFKAALETFPDFDCEILEEAVMGCDACHIGGRMSKYLGKLSGQPYDDETFEDDSNEDSDDENDDDEALKGPYKLGRFCRARAEVFHEFSHWERAMYMSIRQLHENLKNGINAGSFRKDVNDPDDVLAYLEQRGKVRDEWERLSNMMQRAQNLETKGAGRYGGDD